MQTNRTALSGLGRPELVASLPLRRALGVVGFALATAISARVALPLPGTPIPFTFQPMVVLLAGAVLGWRLGLASQVLYLAMGIVGLPVFAAGGGALYLLGPTGGYLMAYPAAAAVAGRASAGLRGALPLLAALAVIYAGGLSWLAVSGDASLAVAWGLRPFVLADLVKVVLVALAATQVRERALQFFGR